MIYLDNAATSHPKPEQVYQAVDTALRVGGSAGRSGHQLALNAARVVLEARELLAQLFNVPASEQIVFTASATEAINQALFGLLQPGDRVVTTNQEHNSVTRPLRALQGQGVEVVKVAADPLSGVVAAADLKQACLESKTRLLLVNHCSNVYGALQPVEQLGGWCREQGIVFMVDGSQSAGSVPIDLEGMQIDLFAAPGHKCLLGPQGTGFLYVANGIILKPLIYGGTGTHSSSDRPPQDLPERLEAGTLNLPGLAGLKAALEFILQLGVEEIRRHELQSISYLLDRLGAIDGVSIYGPETAQQRGAVLSFNIDRCDPTEVGFLLDREENIAVRVGLHCAPDAHRAIGTFPRGTVRVSPGYFTTETELARFVAAIQRLALQC